MSAPLAIDIWSDFSCLWCWFAKHRLGEALTQTGQEAVLTVHSFLIDPDGPDRSIPSAVNLAAKMGVTPEIARTMEMGMRDEALEEGIPYAVDRFHTNGVDAHRVIHLAREHGQAESLFDDLQTDLFEHGKDIYDHRHLVAAAESRGVPRAEVIRVLAGDDYAESVRNEVADARARGIDGVPFVLINRRLAIPGAATVDGYRTAIAQAVTVG